jgi:hypothetical protein
MKQSTADLQHRILSLREDCYAFVRERAVEIGKGCPGVPVENLFMTIASGSSNIFDAALSVIEARRKEAELAAAPAA